MGSSLSIEGSSVCWSEIYSEQSATFRRGMRYLTVDTEPAVEGMSAAAVDIPAGFVARTFAVGTAAEGMSVAAGLPSRFLALAFRVLRHPPLSFDGLGEPELCAELLACGRTANISLLWIVGI